MADSDQYFEDLRKQGREGRPQRTSPPRRPAGGEPRRPVLAPVAGGATATLDAPASGTSDDLEATWGDAAPIPPAPRIGGETAAAAVASPPAPEPVAPPVAAAPAVAPAPAVAEAPAQVGAAPAPATDTRGPVNVHARIQAPDNDRMERIMRQLRRMGWPTNKVEIIGMLVHELPEPADEALADRLLAYRRDIINATEAS